MLCPLQDHLDDSGLLALETSICCTVLSKEPKDWDRSGDNNCKLRTHSSRQLFGPEASTFCRQAAAVARSRPSLLRKSDLLHTHSSSAWDSKRRATWKLS